MLLCIDLGFGLAHVVHAVTGIGDGRDWLVTEDSSYSEFFQYVKIALLVGLLGRWFARLRDPVLGVWTLLFAYVLADDALKVHERVGSYLAVRFGFPDFAKLRSQDYGEMLVIASVGAFFGVLFWVFRSLSPHRNRSAFGPLLLCLVALVFFGGVVDLAHVALRFKAVGTYVGLVEDTGEMLAISVACGYVWACLMRQDLSSNPVTMLSVDELEHQRRRQKV